MERETALLLLVSLGIVAWGALELVEPSAVAGSPDRAARGILALGVLAFGGAALALLGMAPAAPPSPGSGVPERCRRMFFSAPTRDGPTGEEADRGDAPRGERMGPERARLGWARMAVSLGVLSMLAAGLLALSAYSAAVLMALAGTAGALVLRST